MQKTSKVSKTYFAKAIKTGDGEHWLGQFSMPGMVPDFAKEGGQRRLFEYEGAAYVSACVALVGVLMARKRLGSNSPPERYQKLTGEELAVLLAEADLTPTFAAFLAGTSLERMMEMLDGVREPPHLLRVLLEIFKAAPNTIDIAEEVTNAVTTTRQERTTRQLQEAGNGGA